MRDMILKIAITGGPRSGKSTIVKYLKENLPKYNIIPIIVPELATIIFESGFPFEPLLKRVDDLRQFQVQMILGQLDHEKLFTHLAGLMEVPDGYKKVLICDRGTIDNLAYIDEKEHTSIFDAINITYENLKKSYDGVIHLETSAVADGYDKTDNPVRHEDKNEAMQADERTLEVWGKNPTIPHFIVSYCDDFDEKSRMVLNIIRTFYTE